MMNVGGGDEGMTKVGGVDEGDGDEGDKSFRHRISTWRKGGGGHCFWAYCFLDSGDQMQAQLFFVRASEASVGSV